jgi:hypothetical protein
MKASGPSGIQIHRCFVDLISAIKHADDTGFYCYRAIESLRHHCAATHSLTGREKAAQWAKFREVSQTTLDEITPIKEAADGLRHGESDGAGASDRSALLAKTWSIVDRYLKNA